MEIWHLFLQHPMAFFVVASLIILFRKPIFWVLAFLAALPPVGLILAVGLILSLIAVVDLCVQDADFRRYTLIGVALLVGPQPYVFLRVISDSPKDIFTDGGKRIRHLTYLAGALAILAYLWAFNAILTVAPWDEGPTPPASIQYVDLSSLCGRWADEEVDDGQGGLIPPFQNQPKVLIWRQYDGRDRFEVYRVPTGVLAHCPENATAMGWYFTSWNHLGLDEKALRDAPALGPDGRPLSRPSEGWLSKLGLK
jgi:hypothetical protein